MRGNVVPHRVGEKRPGEGGKRRSEAFSDFDEEQLGEIGGVLERDGGVEEIGEEGIEREGKKRRKMVMKEGKERRKRGKHDQKTQKSRRPERTPAISQFSRWVPRWFPRFLANQLLDQRNHAVHEPKTLHGEAARQHTEHNQRVFRRAFRTDVRHQHRHSAHYQKEGIPQRRELLTVDPRNE